MKALSGVNNQTNAGNNSTTLLENYKELLLQSQEIDIRHEGRGAKQSSYVLAKMVALKA